MFSCYQRLLESTSDKADRTQTTGTADFDSIVGRVKYTRKWYISLLGNLDYLVRETTGDSTDRSLFAISWPELFDE